MIPPFHKYPAYYVLIFTVAFGTMFLHQMIFSTTDLALLTYLTKAAFDTMLSMCIFLELGLDE